MSPAGSLSSLESAGLGERGVDPEELRRFGPRFGNLASLYAGRDD